MKYISLDIETSGLDVDYHQILEVACVFDDLEKPEEEIPLSSRRLFRALILPSDNSVVIDLNLLDMHRELLQEIRDAITCPDQIPHRCVCSPESFINHFRMWLNGLYITTPVAFAGKNVLDFDLAWMDEHMKGFCDLPRLRKPVSGTEMVLDPTILFMRPEDTKPPSMAECCERAGIENPSEHTALADALTVTRLIRKGLPSIQNK